MNTWPTPLCPLPAAEDGLVLGLICVVLAALLLFGIALGFWPLRAWLGMDRGRGRFARSFTSDASDLLAIWRLYRHLGRDDYFSVADIPSHMVPDSIADNAADKLPTSGPTTGITGWSIDGHMRLG